MGDNAESSLTYKDAAPASKKVKGDFKTNAAVASSAASEAKQGSNSTSDRTTRQMSREEGCGGLADVRLGWLYESPEDRKIIHCSPVAKPSSSSPRKGKSGRSSKHQLKLPFTSPGQATSAALSSSSPPSALVSPPRPHLYPPLRLRALAVLEEGHDPCSNSCRSGSGRPPQWCQRHERRQQAGMRSRKEKGSP